MNRQDGYAHEAFERHFQKPARWIASAPGRVNLIGEHTDYNDGFVLPMAIEARTVIAAAPNGTRRIVLYSEALRESATIDLSVPLMADAAGHWTNYFKGVVAGFPRNGVSIRGFDAHIHSEVPLGAGLSSSAALSTAAATLLEAVTERRLDPVGKVLLCQSAEHSFAGMPCGIMDPFICSMGRKDHALLLDCRSQEPDWIRLDDAGMAFLVINTQVRHELASGEYAARRRSCETAAWVMNVPSLREASPGLLERRARQMDDNALRCARHVIGEIARTERAAECIRARQWLEFGRLLDASHESLKSDFKVSCAELDAVVAAARAIGPGGGVLGARLTGGGFGGCVVALIESGKQKEIERDIAASYFAATGIRATSFVSRPADGAAVIEV